MSIRWLLSRVGRMYMAELPWRLKQFITAKYDCLFRRSHNLRGQAVAARNQLPPVTGRWPITYFQTQRQWSGEQIFWTDPEGMTQGAQIHWSRINYRNTGRHGDPKVIWELNRHQFLRLWINRHDCSPGEKVTALSHLLLDWITLNPADTGINWSSSLELALRVVSWERAIQSLGEENLAPKVLRVIQRSVHQHALHIARFPSLFSSANNHYIGELTGLMAAAVIISGDQEMRQQAWTAWQTLESESRKQVSPDGVLLEQSTYYHAYVLLFFKLALGYATALGFPVALEFRTIIDRMQYFLDCLTDARGIWFSIGDSDDGNLGALMPWENSTAPVSQPSPDGAKAFAHGGYKIWCHGSHHALFKAGPFGYPSIAAHAHCDQLSVQLKIDGSEILTDCGTCCYHDEDKWRRYFRGTAAHNTVMVNSTHQAEYGGPFLWNTTPSAQLDNVDASSAQGTLRVRAATADYEHRRQVTLDLSRPELLVVSDEIVNAGPGTAQLSAQLIWNFGPTVRELRPVPASQPDNSHAFIITGDGIILRLTVACPGPSTYQIYFGDESEPAGFYSRKFGERIPIYQLRVLTEGTAIQFVTTLSVMETQ